MKHRLFLLAVIAGLALLFAEGALRLYQHSVRNRSMDDALYHPNYRDYFFFGINFKPNSGGERQGLPEIQINSYGFPGDEFQLEKPEGTLRILTFGAGLTHTHNYPLKLEGILQDRMATSVEVINAAVPYWNSTQSLIQFITRGVYLRPNLIVIYHAINDRSMTKYHWLHSMEPVDYRKYSGFLRQNSLLYNFLRKRVVKAAPRRSAGLNKELPADKTPNSQVFRTNISNFVAIARVHGIQVALVTMPLRIDSDTPETEARKLAGPAYQDYRSYLEVVERHNNVLRQFEAQEGVVVVDAAKTTLQSNPQHFTDLCHFTESGANELARLIADAVLPLLSDSG